MKKIVKKQVDSQGRSRQTGALDGSPRKKLMFPVTCGGRRYQPGKNETPVTCGGKLWQCRYQPGEKQVLETIAKKRGVTMSSLFVMNGRAFKDWDRQELKTEARKAGYQSLSEWCAVNIIGPLVKAKK
jgi:hypothetical protein